MPRAATIPILTYHSLDDRGSVLSTPPRLFDTQMRLLRDLGVRVVSLAEVGAVLDGAASSQKIAALTFDDGFQNVYECGLPILQRYGFTATVFLVSDYCGKSNSWPGQPRWIERQPLLGWQQIREMSAAGIRFGCHTRTHPDLRKLSPPEAMEELIGSKKAIEDALGGQVDTFAYPYGAYDETARHLVEAHFGLACSARLGFVKPHSDRHALERLDTYYLRSPLLFSQLFAGRTAAYIDLRRRLRDLRGRVSDWMEMTKCSRTGS